MKTLQLPMLVIHRGKFYTLNETKRHGLVLQLTTNAEIFLDGDHGSCVILTLQAVRVALRDQSLRRSRRTAREGSTPTSLPGLLLSGGPS
jgi:hypothetical protein